MCGELFHEYLVLLALRGLGRDHTLGAVVDRQGKKHSDGLALDYGTHNWMGYHNMKKELGHHGRKELEYSKKVHEIKEGWTVHNSVLVLTAHGMMVYSKALELRAHTVVQHQIVHVMDLLDHSTENEVTEHIPEHKMQHGMAPE